MYASSELVNDQYIDETLENDVGTIWSELNLGSLLSNNRLSLEEQVNNIILSDKGSDKNPVVQHEKRWQQPNYKILKSRYESEPIEPPTASMKSIDRLADPLRGRFKDYDKIKAEINNEENEYEDNRNQEHYNGGVDIDFITNGISNDLSNIDHQIPIEFLYNTGGSHQKKMKSPANDNSSKAFFLTETDEQEHDDTDDVYNNFTHTTTSNTKTSTSNSRNNSNSTNSRFRQKLLDITGQNKQGSRGNNTSSLGATLTKKNVLSSKRSKQYNVASNSNLNSSRTPGIPSKIKKTHAQIQEQIRKKISGKVGVLKFNHTTNGSSNVKPAVVSKGTKRTKVAPISSGYGINSSSNGNNLSAINSTRRSVKNKNKLNDTLLSNSRPPTNILRSKSASYRSSSNNVSSNGILPGVTTAKRLPKQPSASSLLNSSNNNINRGSKSAPSNISRASSNNGSSSSNGIHKSSENISRSYCATGSSNATTAAVKLGAHSAAKAVASVTVDPTYISRDTQQVLSLLEHVGKNEQLRSVNSSTKEAAGMGDYKSGIGSTKGGKSSSDDDAIKQLMLRVKNISGNLQAATAHASKYRELMNEGCKF